MREVRKVETLAAQVERFLTAVLERAGEMGEDGPSPGEPHPYEAVSEAVLEAYASLGLDPARWLA